VPIISGGGAHFNGGTITSPLEIDFHGNTQSGPLYINNVDDPNASSSFQVNCEPVASGAPVFVQLFDTNGSEILLTENTAGVGGLANLFMAVAAGQTEPFLLGWVGGTEHFRVSAAGDVIGSGFVSTALHAAPADAALSAGQAALWFDQTNGASKLMVKAKSANGTVVTGSVTLA